MDSWTGWHLDEVLKEVRDKVTLGKVRACAACPAARSLSAAAEREQRGCTRRGERVRAST